MEVIEPAADEAESLLVGSAVNVEAAGRVFMEVIEPAAELSSFVYQRSDWVLAIRQGPSCLHLNRREGAEETTFLTYTFSFYPELFAVANDLADA